MVHGHSRAPVTTTLPEPPENGNELSELAAEIEHFVPLGAVAVADVEDELQPLANQAPTMLKARSARRTSACWRKYAAKCARQVLLAIAKAAVAGHQTRGNRAADMSGPAAKDR